jgi:hypothetical protein
MESSVILPIQILSHVPGRVRVHLPAWSGEHCRDLEWHLGRVDGVRFVRANPLTGNVLVHFDPARTSLDRLLTMLSTLPARLQTLCRAGEKSRADAVDGRSDLVVRAVVHGALGHAAVDLLFYGATASAYALGWTWVSGLGALHLVLDVVVWGTALRPVAEELRRRHGRWAVHPN